MYLLVDVHVDAKIINRDSKEKDKRTLVAFVVDGKEPEFEEIYEKDASETDAAELYAIDFAMRRLGKTDGKFRLLCDNESVVDVLLRPDPKFKSKTREITKKVWNLLHESDKFQIELFLNKADKFLNVKWKEIKDEQ